MHALLGQQGCTIRLRCAPAPRRCLRARAGMHAAPAADLSCDTPWSPRMPVCTCNMQVSSCSWPHLSYVGLETWAAGAEARRLMRVPQRHHAG